MSEIKMCDGERWQLVPQEKIGEVIVLIQISEIGVYSQFLLRAGKYVVRSIIED